MRSFLLAGVAAAAFSTGAQAALMPITLMPSIVGANAAAVFVFADAADESALYWSQPPILTAPPGAGWNLLFDNVLDPVGTSVAPFGTTGAVAFGLANITQGYGFVTTVADAGVQHFVASTNFADFGVGALPAAAAAAIATLVPTYGSGIFVGVEDRSVASGSDLDFNDLIYWFGSVAVVPGPAALALFGVGLLGLAALRRRG